MSSQARRRVEIILWLFIPYSSMFSNPFPHLAIWLFVESRRSRLVAGTDKETSQIHSLLPLSRHEPQASWLYALSIPFAYSQQRLYGFNPFPLRDFPYLTTFAGAEKVTPLHTYLPLMRHESRASRLYEMPYRHWRNVVTVIQCRWAEKIALRLLQNEYNGHKKTASLHEERSQ